MNKAELLKILEEEITRPDKAELEKVVERIWAIVEKDSAEIEALMPWSEKNGPPPQREKPAPKSIDAGEELMSLDQSTVLPKDGD